MPKADSSVPTEISAIAAADPGMRYRLRGEVDGRELVLELPPGTYLVGSARDCDLRVRDGGVSRRHARIRVDAEGVTITDLGSKNGTTLAGEAADGPGHLAEGEELGLGPVRLRLEALPTEDVELALELDAPASVDELAAETVAGLGGDPARLDSTALDPAELATGQHRTRTRHRRPPVLHLMLELLDRLWATGDTSAALHEISDVFSARAVVLTERRDGAEPLVLAAVGEPEVLNETPEGIGEKDGVGEPEDGYAFEQVAAPVASTAGSEDASPNAGTETRSVGRLRSGSLALELKVYDDAAAPTVAEPLLHAALLWLARPRVEPEPPRRSTAAELIWPEGHVPSRSPAMVELYQQIRAIADGELPILILGETGVGKEHVARLIHGSSKRRRGPLVAINCAAIPADLLEAELFGIGAGVATGVRARRGKLKEADGGTLLLDEIGDMPSALQTKLLRVIQEGRVEPVGGTAEALDVRLLAATHADLRERMEAGSFRRDLYYRLAGLELHVPPLRERRDDVPALVEHLARRAQTRADKRVRGFTVKALRALVTHDWPGNVRELEHEVERAIQLCPDGEAVDWRRLSEAVRSSSRASSLLAASSTTGLDGAAEDVGTDLVARLEIFERRYIVEALEATEGNQTRAAERLGISRNGLILRMKRLGIPSSTGRPTQKRGFRAEPTPERIRRPRSLSGSSAADDSTQG